MVTSGSLGGRPCDRQVLSAGWEDGTSLRFREFASVSRNARSGFRSREPPTERAAFCTDGARWSGWATAALRPSARAGRARLVRGLCAQSQSVRFGRVSCILHTREYCNLEGTGRTRPSSRLEECNRFRVWRKVCSTPLSESAPIEARAAIQRESGPDTHSRFREGTNQ